MELLFATQFLFLFQKEDPLLFPWDTLFVNLSGAFLLTFFLFLPVIVENIKPIFLTAITTGLIGSYTTFSTINLDVIQLLQHSILKAVGYICITIIGGLILSYLGFRFANLLGADMESEKS